jgi:hypothetical protein
MMECYIRNKATNKKREVKNLGWLLRNAYRCVSLELNARKEHSGCVLIAQISERGIPAIEYVCECRSFNIMHKWVRRPCLSHVVKFYKFPETPQINP